MGKFVTTFEGLADAIVSECLIFPPADLDKGEEIKEYYHTNIAAWDTGAGSVVISPKVAQALSLSSRGRAIISGAGGDKEGDVCRVHIGLPSGELFENVEVVVDELPDYDILLGMPIISQMDFAITHPNGNTKFTYERPSKRDLDFTKE